MIKKILFLLLAIVLQLNLTAQICFNPAILSYSTTTSVNSVASADFNADGNTDIVITDNGTTNISVRLGTGNGNLGAVSLFNVGAPSQGIITSDLNNDGKVDIALTHQASNSISVLMSDGAGNFNSPTNYTVFNGPNELSSADYNGDGNIDLAVTNYMADSITVLFGTGAGSFSVSANYITGTAPLAIISNDFNHDNFIDLGVANGSSNTVSILLNTGAGNFSPAVNYTVGTCPNALTCADLNGDTYLDIATTNGASSRKTYSSVNGGNVSILLGDGAGNFGTTNNILIGAFVGEQEPDAIKSADFNGDAIIDLAVAWNAHTDVYLGTGTGTSFSSAYKISAGTVASLTCKDFNGDNKPDLIGVTETLNYITELLNGPMSINITGPTTICNGSNTYLSVSGIHTYTWSANAGSIANNGATLSPSSNTIYTVSGTNFQCTSTQTVLVNVTPLPTVIATTNNSLLCVGSTAVLTASGATSYTWSTNATTNTISVPPTSNTNYTVTGESNGCTNTSVITQSVHPLPVITVAGTASVTQCYNTTLTASGASTYTWSANAGGVTTASVVLSPTVATNYTVTGSDGICAANKAVIVSVSQTTLNVSGTTSICTGSSTTLTASGSTNYTWMPGGITTNSVVVNPTSTTVYTVTGVAGTCNFVKTVTVTVNSPSTPTATASSYTICAGTSTTLTASGSLSYTWAPGSITTAIANVTPASSTTYTLTGKNGACPASTTTLAVHVNNSLNVNSPSLCPGSSTTLTATGSSTGYLWSTGATTASIVVSPTVTTNYTVTGTDTVNGCSISKTSTVTANTIPTVTVSSNHQTVCAGASVAAITFTVSPYTANISWTNNNTATGLAAASTSSGNINGFSAAAVTSQQVSIITINATTPSGCTMAAANQPTYTLTVNPKPAIAVSAFTACPTSASTLTASGANTYTWNTGNTGASITPSPTVTTHYTVTGTDANNCVNTATTSIRIYKDIYIQTNETNSNGGATVTGPNITACQSSVITFTAYGGTNYTWNTGATGPTYSDTPSVTTSYTLTATDSSGCSVSKVTTASIVATPTVSIIGNNFQTVCTGAPVAPITFSVSPAGAYASWNNNNTATGLAYYNTGNINGFTAAAVTSPQVSIISINATTPIGCQSDPANQLTYTLTVNSTAPTITATNNVYTLCNGTSQTLSVNGANTYTWAPAASLSDTSIANPVANPTTTTVYTVTGSSACGTSAPLTVTLNVNPTPTVNINIAPTCVSTCVSPITGITPSSTIIGSYSWNWGDGSAFSTTAQPCHYYAVAGTYSVTLTIITVDGCTLTATAMASVIPTPTITVNPIYTVCVGSTATICASGANTYTWSPPSFQSNVTGTCINVNTPGNYTVQGTDANGCNSYVVSTLVQMISNPTVSISAAPVNCNSLCQNFVGTISSSSVATYVWDFGDGSPNATNTSVMHCYNNPLTTVASLTVTDANGCVGTATTNVVVNPMASAITLSVSSNAICAGTSAVITPSGANTYSLFPSNLTSSINFTVAPTSNVTYTVIGSNNQAGCADTVTTTITVNALPPAPILSGSSASMCAGSPYAITVNSGTVTAVWYSNNTVVNVGSTFTPPNSFSPGTYTYSIIDSVAVAGGCINAPQSANTVMLTLVINPLPSPPVAVVNAYTVCLGTSSTFSVNSGTGFAIWYSNNNPINVGPTYTPPSTLTAGTYTYSVIDSIPGGCINAPQSANTATLSFVVLPAPVVSFSLTQDAAPHAWDAYPTYSSNTQNAIWYWGDGDSTISLYPSHTYTAPSHYNVCVTTIDTAGCSANYCINDSLYRMTNNTIITLNVINTASGIQNYIQQNINLYPNPNNGTFIIETNNPAKQIMQIFDVNGRLVLTQTITGKTIINASDLINGVYSINISSSEGVANKRLIIAK